MRTPDLQQMQEFAKLAKSDLASAYLALSKIKKWGLTLDHPRAAMLARGEMNRSTRSEWACGLTMPKIDGPAGVVDAETPLLGERGAMRVDEGQLAPRFQAKPEKEPKKWPMALINLNEKFTEFSPGQIDEESEREQQVKRLLQLKNQLKSRDREVLELRFEQGLSIQEIAEKVEKTDGAIYATFHKLKSELKEIKERQDWVDAHCSLDKLAGGVESAPVILQANQQLGWDLGVQP